MRSRKDTIGFEDPVHVTRPLTPSKGLFKRYLEDIISSGKITNVGKYHQMLEDGLRKCLKVRNVSLMNNGTNGLLIALKACGLSGSVITTPFTFAATAQSISWMGAEPVFVDVDDETLDIDAGLLEDAISDETGGILPVHVFGTPCDVKTIGELAERHSLKIVYDGAHAFGTEIEGTGIGNYGDVTMFSFHATKLFNTIEGGALVCNDDNLRGKIDRMRNFGIRNENEVELPGINGKLNEIQCAWGLAVLERMERERKRRQTISRIYHENLDSIDGIRICGQPENVRKSLQYFVIRIEKARFGRSRDAIFEDLKRYNIFARKYFHPLCSDFPFYSGNGSASRKNLPVAYKVSEEVLSMPFHGRLKDEDIERICNTVRYLREE